MGEVRAEFGCPAPQQPVSKLGKAVRAGLLSSALEDERGVAISQLRQSNGEFEDQ